MSQENITLILLAVIGLVFLIDFIKNNSKKSINESVDKFVKNQDFPKNAKKKIFWSANFHISTQNFA